LGLEFGVRIRVRVRVRVRARGRVRDRVTSARHVCAGLCIVAHTLRARLEGVPG